MKRLVGVLLAGILVVSFALPGFADSKKGDAVDIGSRIHALEVELAALKKLIQQDDPALKTTGIHKEPKLKTGTRVFLDGTRGWDENGINMWTAVGALPNYNVGIGTSTPWVKLEVAGHIRANRGALTNIEVFANCSSNPAWDYAGIALSNGTYFPATRLQTFGPAHTPAHEFHLRHYPNAPVIISTDNSERMRIAGNGNVGIGNPNPLYRLDVTGDIRVTGGIHDGATFGLASQVLVADGIGGVAWAGSPGGSADYIWNQDTAAQTPADFWIDGTGRADNTLIGLNSAVDGIGVNAQNLAATGGGTGVYAVSQSDVAFGVVAIGGGAGTWWNITGEDAGVTSTGLAYGVIGWGHDNTAGAEGVGVLGVGNPQAAATVRMASGAGVCGYSPTDHGVYGATDADNAFGIRGYNAVLNGCGILGIGDGVASGTYAAGSGVSGSSDYIGVAGYGDATAGSRGMYTRSFAANGLGLMAAGNNMAPYTFSAGGGIEASGTTRGVTGFGENTASSMGVYGYGLDAGGAGAGVFARHGGLTGTACVGMGNGGTSYVTLVNGSGGAFTGDSIGVAGYSFANPVGAAAGGYFDNYYGTMYAYVATEFGTGYKINGAGLVATIMETRAGKKNLFAPESPEPWFEDIGEDQLRNGSSGKIELDPFFLDCITVDDEHPLKVFVQLLDNCNGVYVKRYDDGFEVVELNDGTSNAKFCYRVIGAWKGNEDIRFPDAPPRLARNAHDAGKDVAVRVSVENDRAASEDGAKKILNKSKDAGSKTLLKR